MPEQTGKVYVVFREGVYRHECGGVFTDLAAATLVADNLARGDSDDYHEYKVVPFVLNDQPLVDNTGELHHGSPDIHEDEPLYTISRSGILEREASKG